MNRTGILEQQVSKSHSAGFKVMGPGLAEEATQTPTQIDRGRGEQQEEEEEASLNATQKATLHSHSTWSC